MTKYISILRGINVGGKRKILMADLKSLYESLGFKGITTYIQSGNVVFESDNNQGQKEIGLNIEQVIKTNYDFAVPVIVRTVQEFENIITNNPFLKNKEVDNERLHLTYLAEIPAPEKIKNLKKLDFQQEKFEIIGNNVFIYCTEKYSDSKLGNNFLEKKLKTTATTRNWKTVNKLYDIARGI